MQPVNPLPPCTGRGSLTLGKVLFKKPVVLSVVATPVFYSLLPIFLEIGPKYGTDVNLSQEISAMPSGVMYIHRSLGRPELFSLTDSFTRMP